MKSLPYLTASVVLLLLGAARADFHVAVNGSDQNPGTADKPFATLEHARDAVRALKHEGDLRVLLHDGTYPLTAPLVFTAADRQTIYEAAPGSKPVLSGGRRVTGWKEVTVAGHTLWAAELPGVKEGKEYFRQLWVNGQRRTRARHPNTGFLKIEALPETVKTGNREPGQDRFTFAPGDLKAWNNLKDVEVVALHLWVGVRLPVKSVDEEPRLVTFERKSRRPLKDGKEPARYWVENALELLDSPGEWYLDRSSGLLYYWPLPGERLDQIEAIVPRLPNLLRLDGPITSLTFRGLTFAHTEWAASRDAADMQASAEVPAAIQCQGTRGCTFENCTIAHTGGYGLALGRGCKSNTIKDCEFTDLGAGGIQVGEMAVRDNAEEQASGNILSDNHIHDGGRVFPQAVGVWIGQSPGNQVVHNHIHDLYYTGISVGWTWGYGKSLARDNLIAFNHVHDLGKDWLSDLGGIYTLGMQPGTKIVNNVFHDIAGHQYGGWGIYLDEGSTDIVAENNLVYRTTHGGFHQHYGRDNVVRNNLFALGRDAQLQRTRVEPHRSFTFEHNIVYWTEGKLFAGKWEDGGVALDHNLYWHAGGDVRFGSLTLEQWQARGKDQHSRIADPLFVNPGKADFRLKEGSPAEKVGFHLPDLSTVGTRPAK